MIMNQNSCDTQVGAASRAGRGRRSVSLSPNGVSNTTIITTNSIVDTHHKELDDQLILMVPMDHTRPKFRILRLQTSLKNMVKMQQLLCALMYVCIYRIYVFTCISLLDFYRFACDTCLFLATQTMYLK